MKILLIIIFIIALYGYNNNKSNLEKESYECSNKKSNLEKNQMVIFYYLDGKNKVLNYSDRKDIDWEKIVKELENYDIQQKINNKLLIVNDREIGEYDYINHKKTTIYTENEKKFSIDSALIVDNNILFINQYYSVHRKTPLTDDYVARLIKYNLKTNKKEIIDTNTCCDINISFNKNGDILYSNYDEEEKRIYTKKGKIYAYKDGFIRDIKLSKDIDNMNYEDFKSIMTRTKDRNINFEINYKCHDWFERTNFSQVLTKVDEETGDFENIDEGKIYKCDDIGEQDAIEDLKWIRDVVVIQLDEGANK